MLCKPALLAALELHQDIALHLSTKSLCTMFNPFEKTYHFLPYNTYTTFIVQLNHLFTNRITLISLPIGNPSTIHSHGPMDPSCVALTIMNVLINVSLSCTTVGFRAGILSVQWGMAVFLKAFHVVSNEPGKQKWVNLCNCQRSQ